MNLREMPLEVISHDSILGRSMYNVNKDAHDQLAKQMKEWERKKGNKVYIAKMGETGDTKDTVQKEKGKIGSNAARKQSTASSRRSKTGHQNLLNRRDGLYLVMVSGVKLGVFEKEEALKVRDKYRIETNLPAADY